MELEQILIEAEKDLKSYLNEANLDADAELQMLASAYSVLFLKALGNRPTKEIATAHKQIADCLKCLNENKLSERHLRLFQAYLNASSRN